MKRNAIRIVCNPYTNQIAYFFRNELGEWMIVSSSSPLSRQYYTRTTIEERCKNIIKKLDEIYNRKNKGLDIFFEGTSANYNYFSSAMKEYCPDRDIVCKLKITKIAVVGKKASGKSTLIEGIANEKGHKLESIKKDQYMLYIDKSNNINWIEVNGIGFGKSEISKATSIIQDLVKDDLSTVIYCISGDSGNVENIEKRFIENLNTSFPSITVLTVLTNCYKEDMQRIIDEVEKLINHMEVFPTLAKKYKTRGDSVVVAPFGIKELCSFVFEGKKLPHKFQDELKAATIYCDQKSDTSHKKPKEIKAVNKSPFHKKEIDLLSVKQLETNSTRKNITLNVIGKTNHCSKKDECWEDVPANKVLTSLVKETKSDDVLEKKPIFKKIAIVGKRNVGKTTLIEGMETYVGQPFIKVNGRNYTVYEDRKNNIRWYDVKGIDLGKDKVKEAYTTVEGLIADGLKTIFYCISGDVGRIEDLEKELIKRLETEYPKVSVVVAFTMCYKEDIQDIVIEIKKLSGKLEIIQTLARDYKTRIKIPGTGDPLIIQSYGLDSIYQYINGDR